MNKYVGFFSGCKVFLFACFLLLLSGCDIDLYSSLTEQEANAMMSVLLRHGVDANKIPGKKSTVILRVPKDQISLAVEILNANGYPKIKHQDLCEVFKKEGMISSPLEEAARYVCALSEEISHTISNIDGVIVARVHVVLPESDKLGKQVQPSSASVFIKHKQDVDMKSNVPKIKHLVQNSIKSLAYEHITVEVFPSKQVLNAAGDAFAGVNASTRGADAASGLQISSPILLLLVIIIVGLTSLSGYLLFSWSKMSKKLKAAGSAARRGSGALKRTV